MRRPRPPRWHRADRGYSARHASTHLPRHPRRPRRHRARPGDRGADRRDHPRDDERHLRLGPAPLRGARPVHRQGRHPRPRADGDRRGGRRGGHGHRPGRPRRDPVQHLLRALLHVRQGAAVAVRDDPGPRAGHRRGAVRLHEALRPGARRPGRVPARAAGALRADQGARGAARRPLRLPLRRPADRLAGGRVRRRPGRRDAARARPRPDRRDEHARRPAPRRGPGHRDRPRARAAGARPRARRRDARPHAVRERRPGRGRARA